MILAVFNAIHTSLCSSEVRPEKFIPERDSKPDRCGAGAVLYKLSYHANWELVTLSVDYIPVDDGCR